MADELKVHCPVCNFEVGTKEDGTKIKAHRVAGEKCDGSDTELIDVSGIDAGDTFELPSTDDENDAQGDENDAPDESLGDDESEPESAAQVFTHVLRVHESCPYLDDTAWQAGNKRLVMNEAKRAGLTTDGEASMTDVRHSGDQLHLIYTVPIK